MTDTGEPFEERPLFQRASAIVPMEQLREHFENLKCGNYHFKGCNIPKDYPNLYYCRVCMAVMALGTDFSADDKKITDTMINQMLPWQHQAYNTRAEYNQKWLDNYPRGATG